MRAHHFPHTWHHVDSEGQSEADWGYKTIFKGCAGRFFDRGGEQIGSYSLKDLEDPLVDFSGELLPMLCQYHGS